MSINPDMNVESGESGETKLPFVRLNNPFIQNCVVTMCIFCNPGLYLAITMLGAGGGRTSSTTMANTSNGVLYGVFVFSAILAGTMLNTIGPRLTMLCGIVGYPVYIGAMWYFDAYGNLWYPIFAGVIQGISAGCLWTTAAYISSAYATEKEKGVWRAMQWTGNISGASVGASIALGLLDGFDVASASPGQIATPGWDSLALFEPMTLWESLKLTGSLFKDWRFVVLIPACFTPEAFFPFQASMNAYAFSLRTRILNSLLNNLIQIPVTMLIGFLLDTERLGSRKKRAFYGITFDAVWITGAYIAQTIWLSSWKFDRSIPGPSIDCTDPAYAGAVVIYMLYASQYGVFQNVVLYVLGTLTNDPRRSAAASAFFIAWLSAGTSVSFGVDATMQPYENENAAWFALSTISWPLLYFITWKYTSATNYRKEQNVIAPIEARKQADSEKVKVEAIPSAIDQ